MSPHPNFSRSSNCMNCAAFEPEGSARDPSRKDDDFWGVCHRHAPRPNASAYHFPRDEEASSTTEFRDNNWPWVNASDGQMFCCEWLPKPGGEDKQ